MFPFNSYLLSFMLLMFLSRVLEEKEKEVKNVVFDFLIFLLIFHLKTVFKYFS